MKNLSAIPRLLETFTILITLVVCLVGFTEAEVHTNYRKQDSNQGESYLLKEALLKQNVPYAHQTSKMTENESEDRNVAIFRDIPLDKLIERHWDELGESDETDEKESDGYGYDDDEYYHFNFKRNDENIDNSKSEKESVHDSNEKEGVSSQKYLPQSQKDKTKETETIEMLNFKETHPNIDVDTSQNPAEGAKQYPDDLNRKKSPTTTGILSSLKMSDLRENSAIDEKMKERKEESSLSSGKDGKAVEGKSLVKGSEEKDSVKVKESKLTEESEHKEKESSLKEGKEAVVGKNIKENPKSTEEKDKGVKLSDSAKLQENLEKISSKTKETDSPKLTKEDTDIIQYTEKLTSDVLNPMGLNENNNRASFVSNDYKDVLKTGGVEEDEKNSEETSGLERNIGLSDYQNDIGRNQENFKKFYNERDVDGSHNYASVNLRDNNAQIFRDSKSKEYTPLTFELQNLSPNSLFSRADNKDANQEALKFLSQLSDRQRQAMQEQQQYFKLQQQLSQDPQSTDQSAQMSEPQYKNVYGLNIPNSELENTDYHKNYIKSLKRYKSINTETKGTISEHMNSAGYLHPPSNCYADLNCMKQKVLEPVKRRSPVDTHLEEKESSQSKHSKLRRNANKGESLSSQTLQSTETCQAVCKSKDDAKLSEGKKAEGEEGSFRARRKSPIKLEYEIKVINQSPPDLKNGELSHIASRRFEKDLKSKLATEEKYLKKYPYSQVSRDDLTRFGDTENERKYKRKASTWKKRDKKSAIQTRAAPSGYYGNRVKFGQRNYARNNERTNPDQSALELSHGSSSYFNSETPSSLADKSKLQRSWEVRQEDYKHDPMKRYDESGYMNKGNSLLLVRKGEKTMTTFDDGTSQPVAVENNLNSDNLAKILSRDNDYIILKKTDSNKFQKISENNPPTPNTDVNGATYQSKFAQDDQQEGMKTSMKQAVKNKGLYVRSFHVDKDDKKLTSTSHSSKSNLKKTFDKFRDLAGFFKDNEQESTDNHYSAQELKEGRDIVFSENKLPDPIVITTDGSGKSMAFNQKQPNSIYSISTNFKTLDQQDKKNEVPPSNEADKNMFTAEAKSDSTESSWEPALKSIFPEAKSINAMSKNGNEIIILDLNRNQLKPSDRPNMKIAPPKQQQYGTFGMTSQVPSMGNSVATSMGGNVPGTMMGNAIPNNNAVQVTMSLTPAKTQTVNKALRKTPFKSRSNSGYAAVRTDDGPDSQVSIGDLSDLPSLLRTLSDKKPNVKLLTKRSPPRSTDIQISDNYRRFLSNLKELSELNKSNNGKGKLNLKKSTDEIVLPSSSFPELSTYGDANIKYLGNLLQNIMTGENPEFKSISGGSTENSDGGISKYLEENLRASKAYVNSESNHNTKSQRRWSVEGKTKDYLSLEEEKSGYDFLRSQRGTSEDSNYQDEILAELAAASDKINKLSREGVGARKLRKTIEDSLALSGKHESRSTDASAALKLEDTCRKLDSESVSSNAKDKREGSEIKSEQETKESSDKSLLKSDYESNLNEFFENLNANKNQKDQLNVPKESTWERKKRKENHRRKRSASRDVKNKVSTTAVQNTILKNLAEDNYQSIYSPGIKRRLFSTNNEADDADNYSDAYERDINVIAEEPQPKCVKNSLNKCIDPLIVELFGAVDKEEKNRARRSLTSGFHSNFKREIDLDESMPNDFQNFLVTSLGGFGSQNREVIKKDVALWERKESTQDANQIVDSSPPVAKDDPNSTLEKREVSSSENRKGQAYFQSELASESSLGDLMGSQKLRPESKTKLKAKAEFNDEKLPTQIRIQITNASSKEKKSSKPIMDESETTSAEMENVPKEKEFFDKNKVNTLNSRLGLPKVYSSSKSKYSFSDYEVSENTDSNGSQGYRPRRRRRKKKKYVTESATKPIKDFIKFDQKAMETFLKRVMSDQNTEASSQTTQKSPISNHLPQVETVYNPTQGTNKAQLEVSRFGQTNSASNKNTGTVKNNLQSTDPMLYDEGIMRNYLKDKTDKIKSEKVKEYEDIDWKPSFGKMRLRQELGWEPSNSHFTLPSLKGPITGSTSLTMNTNSPALLNPFSQHLFNQKTSPPTSSYFYHSTNTNADSSNGLYDAMKLKQEFKNQNALTTDHTAAKIFKKPLYYNNMGLYNTGDKDPNQNSLFPSLNMGDSSWNYQYSMAKKPTSRIYKNRDYFSSEIKNQNRLDSKGKLSHSGIRKFMKSKEDDKSPILDTPKFTPILENSKDTDYLDNLGVDDDYLDDDSGKELQTEEPLFSVPMKYHRFYNSDLDDNVNEEYDDGIYEDYDENGEDEDIDDYSLLANAKAMEPELTKTGHRKAKFHNSVNDNRAFSQFSYHYPKDDLLELRGHSFEQTEFNSKNDAKFGAGRQQIPLVDFKSDTGSLATSTSLLKKANGNSNIFGKNLLKNTYGLNPDDLPSELSKNKMKEFYHHNKLYKMKRDGKMKLKRSRDFPQIGSRLFYAAKTEMLDNDSEPIIIRGQTQQKLKNSRHTFGGLNRLDAEFVGPGGNFDEFEENGNSNLVNFGKGAQEEDKKNKQSDEGDGSEFSDVAENMEDDGDTISQDNVLENVIGKYIMRKRVASSADLNNPEGSQTEGQHSVRKRSIGNRKYEKALDVKLVKRLSSGHLTENNFRKYHKKNLTRKREVNEFDLTTRGSDRKSTLRKNPKRESTSQRKRSALDIFKKITSKDRDSKKVENVEGRTAGFEPLSSLSDKKYESSIRDTKFEFLNQVKKLSNEFPQTPMKSSLVDLKPHLPNEDQLISEQRKKDKQKLTMKDSLGAAGQGPWRIELNDKYDLKYGEYPKAIEKLKAPVNQDNENLKAFLVFSSNLRGFKRSTVEGLTSTSGSSQKEVGNNYRPKSDEGRRISKMHVSKRSLDSSLVTGNDEDAQTSRDGEQITESHVNLEEKNRALHDTKSLSEGDSKPPTSQVLQRNNKSFVNDDEQWKNTRFPSTGKLNNLKSVFPPSNDANIMRDSRQVNEETSKYLGHQIVGAILSHVSANPKLKEMIAPGLNARTTAYKEDFGVTQRPFHQTEISDQLQFFLQKFMIDLEKLAEKHVRKRMCTQIDQESRDFLQSLLNVPTKVNKMGNENCPVSDEYPEMGHIEEDVLPQTTTQTPQVTLNHHFSREANSTQGQLENLRKKHHLLLKLIQDYEKLSLLEKDSLHVNYGSLLKELRETNKEMGAITGVDPDSITVTCHTCPKPPPPQKPEMNKPNTGFENTSQNPTNSECPNCTLPTQDSPTQGSSTKGSPTQTLPTQGSLAQDSTVQSFPVQGFPMQGSPMQDSPMQGSPQPTLQCCIQPVQSEKLSSSSDNCTTPKPIVLPTYAFEEDISKSEPVAKPPTPSVFEEVNLVNISQKCPKCPKWPKCPKCPVQKTESFVHLSSQTPQTFDLLPDENITQKDNSNSVGLSPANVDGFRLQQSLFGTDDFETSQSQFDLKNASQLTELNKLSLGDAAGLQLSLKYRGPWVSNLDVAKTIRNVPVSPVSATKQSPSKPDSAGSFTTSHMARTLVEAPTVAEVRNARSLLSSSNDEYISLGSPLLRKSFSSDFFPYTHFQTFESRTRPFESVTKNFASVRCNRIPCNYYLRKFSTSGRNRVFLRSNSLSQSLDNFLRYPNPYQQSKSSFLQSSIPFQQSPNPVMLLPNTPRKSANILTSEYPDIFKHSNIHYPLNCIQKTSEALPQFPTFSQKNSEVRPQSSSLMHPTAKAVSLSQNFMLQTHNVAPQSRNLMHPTDEAMVQSQNFVHQAPDAVPQSGNFLNQIQQVVPQSRNTMQETPDVMSQPQNLMSQPPGILTQTPANMPEISNILSQPTNALPQNELLSKDFRVPGISKESRPFMGTDFLKKAGKKGRPFGHIIMAQERKRKNKKKSKKSVLTTKNSDEKDYEDDKDAELEYLAWSTMPAVRRQLNKLERGLELDDFFLKNKKLEMSKGGEKKSV